jgi:transposase InsO family protein
MLSGPDSFCHCLFAINLYFMDKKHDAIAFAASLIFKVVIIAAKYSGRVRKRSLKRLAARDANQLALLNIFISASTVRNILNRPKPRKRDGFPVVSAKTQEKTEPRSIPAWHPIHVWSIDTTELSCWGLWPIQVCVVIDHFSRKVMAAAPFEGRNAGWINNALECAIERHGSIAVTERVIKTLKYEWLKRVSFIRGFDHLVTLCEEFEDWYNTWRPHMTLDGFRPDDVYYDRKPEKPKRTSKTVPRHIDQHLFRETRITGYRLKDVA